MYGFDKFSWEIERERRLREALIYLRKQEGFIEKVKDNFFLRIRRKIIHFKRRSAVSILTLRTFGWLLVLVILSLNAISAAILSKFDVGTDIISFQDNKWMVEKLHRGITNILEGIYPVAHHWWEFSLRGIFTPKFFYNLANQFPVYFAAALAALAVCYYPDWRASRELSFKLIDFVHSKEFSDVRFNVWSLMIESDGRCPVEDLSNWLPTDNLQDISKLNRNNDKFRRSNSVFIMANFVYQLSMYHKLGLINLHSLRVLLGRFFSHYQIFLLELAYSHIEIRKMLEEDYHLDERWDEFPNEILYFFEMMGLGNKLPCKYKRVFFPKTTKDEGSALN